MATEKAGKVVNRVELATVFGISPPTVDDWLRNQMPYLQKGAKGREWQFDTAACIQWRVDFLLAKSKGDDDDEDNSLDAQIKRVELETKRLKYASAAKLIVPVDQLKHALVGVFAVVRAGMRNVPARCVSQIIGSSSESHIRGVLEREVDSALTSVATFDISKLVSMPADDDDEEAPEPEAPGE